MQKNTLYTGRVLELAVESTQLPNGVSVDLEIVHHGGGAAVVALNRNHEVCLLRQYRYAASGWLWELPAGKREAGEQGRTTAERELAEEAGRSAARWQALGSLYTTPGFCDEVIELFLATELEEVARQHQADEVIEVHWMSLEAAIRQVQKVLPWDAKSLLGLLLARDKLRNDVAADQGSD